MLLSLSPWSSSCFNSPSTHCFSMLFILKETFFQLFLVGCQYSIMMSQQNKKAEEGRMRSLSAWLPETLIRSWARTWTISVHGSQALGLKLEFIALTSLGLWLTGGRLWVFVVSIIIWANSLNKKLYDRWMIDTKGHDRQILFLWRTLTQGIILTPWYKWHASVWTHAQHC